MLDATCTAVVQVRCAQCHVAVQVCCSQCRVGSPLQRPGCSSCDQQVVLVFALVSPLAVRLASQGTALCTWQGIALYMAFHFSPPVNDFSCVLCDDIPDFTMPCRENASAQWGGWAPANLMLPNSCYYCRLCEGMPEVSHTDPNRRRRRTYNEDNDDDRR